MKRHFRLLSFIPLLVMMYMIWSFSAQAGDDSMGQSMRVGIGVVRAFDRVFKQGWSDETVLLHAERLQTVFRKGAHITEYFLLALSAVLPLIVYRVRNRRTLLYAALFCVAFACLDEWHQTFVDGRSGAPVDVLVDCCGVFPGIAVMARWKARPRA